MIGIYSAAADLDARRKSTWRSACPQAGVRVRRCRGQRSTRRLCATNPAELARVRSVCWEKMSQAIAAIVLDGFVHPGSGDHKPSQGFSARGRQGGVSIDDAAAENPKRQGRTATNGVPVGPDTRMFMSSVRRERRRNASCPGPTVQHRARICRTDAFDPARPPGQRKQAPPGD